MATRIFCFIIAIVFLVSVVGYTGYIIYQFQTEDSEDPKTSAEINQERLDRLPDIGLLEGFEPLSEQINELALEEIENPAVNPEAKSAQEGDVATFSARYALAQSGQIFLEHNNQSENTPHHTFGVDRFCGDPKNLIGLKIGGKRRVFIPAEKVSDCGLNPDIWPSEFDLVIEIELIGLADRNQQLLDVLGNRGSLPNFDTLSEKLDIPRFEEIEVSTEGRAVEAGDLVALEARYALAQNGQIFFEYSAQADDRPLQIILADDFCGYPEALLGLKTNGRRRVFIPAEQIGRCSNLILITEFANSEFDLVIDLQLVEFSDNFIGYSEHSLKDFKPLSKSLSKIITEDIQLGSGEAVEVGDSITVDYTGVLASNGEVFDANKGIPFDIVPGQIIVGWQEGLAGLKVGGIRRLSIPAAKGYGDSARGSIPANSDLIFDVRLISID